MILEVPEQGDELEDDQQRAFDAYHLDGASGRICVDAGAGTGKTKTLVDTVAETVLVELETGNANPMQDILITTFNVDAAAELKTKLKRRLRQHEDAVGDSLDPDIWRQIETEANIQTIDSFTNDLLSEIAAELNLPTSFDIREQGGLDEADLYDEIMESLRDDPDIADVIDHLEDLFPDRDWLDYPPSSLQDLLVEAHEKRREFCWSIDELQHRLEYSVRHQMYAGREPPFDHGDVEDISRQLAGDVQTVTDELVDHVHHVFHFNLEMVEAFGRLVERFDEEYESKMHQDGELSYTDVTYYVWETMASNSVENWTRSLEDRFDHIFIDEFQDTNYAQSRILSRFVRNDQPQNGILLIGDVKQSIYQWRSAEPRIFAEIIEHAREQLDGTDEFLEIEGMEYQALTSNFRSHADLVKAANHLFSEVFADRSRGDIGFEVPYTTLTPRRAEINPEGSHFHVVHTGQLDNYQDMDAYAVAEADRFAQFISGLLAENQAQVVDAENSDPIDDPEFRNPRAGDVALLFRRRAHMGLFARRLEEYGVTTALDVTSGLFGEPEIRLLIDVFDWFAHPHSKNSLIRILRSPITAISDDTLRYLASKKFYLSWGLEEWPGDDLLEEDRDRVASLIELRDDLRWDREGPKSGLIHRTIRHTAFDAIVLSDDDGKKRFGNIWQLIEVVNQWEEEELLDYREFVSRLMRLRDRALDGEDEYPIAQIADEDSEDTVRLTTVHKSKGMEYPIVFMPDLNRSAIFQPWSDRMLLSRQHGIALHPQTGEHDTVDYDPGSSDAWIKSQGSGTIWVSDSKRNDGTLQYQNELQRHLIDDIAEHWRILYVAFTRASDHLFLGLPSDQPHDQHESWMAALQEAFQPADDWPQGQSDISVEWTDSDGLVRDQITLGVDDIRGGARVEPDPIGIGTVETAIQYPQEDIESVQLDFIPRTVTPTALHDLIRCPLRFQYRMLQGVSELRGDVPPESDPPEPLQPHSWGTVVHRALQSLHTEQDDLDHYLEAADDSVETKLREEVIPNYESTNIWEQVNENAEQVLSEYELEGILRQARSDLYLSGKIDLLYETASGWHIADFKTGGPPSEESYLHEGYKYQIWAYAWLLRDAFNISVESATLVYVHPEVEEVSVTVNLEEFVDSLEEVPASLDLEIGEGLAPNPDPEPPAESLSVYSKCGSCAYRSLCPIWRDTDHT